MNSFIAVTGKTLTVKKGKYDFYNHLLILTNDEDVMTAHMIAMSCGATLTTNEHRCFLPTVSIDRLWSIPPWTGSQRTTLLAER